MGDLLSKTTLLFPLIFASLQSLTTTIRREPFLLAKDSITFIDVLGREYVLQHSYFRDWPVSGVCCQPWIQSQPCAPGSYFVYVF